MNLNTDNMRSEKTGVNNRNIYDDILSSEHQRLIRWSLAGMMLLLYAASGISQNGLDEQIYQAQSQFQPTIKDAVKFSDVPEIKDTVKRIQGIQYGISSAPLFPKYEVLTIEPAKMRNETLNKLYHSLLKVGYAPIYSMPLMEFRSASGRARENSYGAHLRHFSSSAHLRDVGYSGFSDNSASLFGKKFYKKHTLSGDLNYSRNVYHYYGYDTSVFRSDDRERTRQRYQLIEPKLRLQSHYSDSTHANYNAGLSFYNLQNLHQEAENNIRADATTGLLVNREKLNIGFLADFYNHKQGSDTLNNLILSLSPSFEANGKKWHADIGLTGTLDHFRDKTKFYFYPALNLHYDIYESIVIPYAGVKGGLIKNSLRSLSGENPFVDTTINYTNTNNRINIFGGLRGNVSSNTSYDAGVSFSQHNNMHFFVIDYSATGRANRFNVIFDNATLLNVYGEMKYQANEKLNLIAKGNYYLYKTETLQRAYHKPDLDMTFSGIYNIKSKIIVRADLFILGQQWALTQEDIAGVKTLKPQQIKGWADMNLEAEYRYTKMLSFFARFNNIANQRYYRWERYPNQRFNFMIGLSFVPF
jgi:hypothetical protein